MSTHGNTGNGDGLPHNVWKGMGSPTQTDLSPVSVAADLLRHLADDLLVVAQREGISMESRTGLWTQEARLALRSAADSIEESSARSETAVAQGIKTLEAQVASIDVVKAEMREQTRLLEKTRAEDLVEAVTRRALDILPMPLSRPDPSGGWAGIVGAAPMRAAVLLVTAFGMGASAVALHRGWTEDPTAVQARARIEGCQAAQVHDSRTGVAYCPMNVLRGQR